MKQGKKPNRGQMKAIQNSGLDSNDWLVVKFVYGELHLIHRLTNRTNTIPA
ncbi:DUF6906 family protein [Bacillus suaedae]|uniref:DUF6906 domain-containing protein n=1 Tax=Halalkalibacter suaedae TaxID=2822140 RepID=A0A940WXT1_9BACI|nr:hypothetical protein [Bacillus suaedae]MBP3950310.1 hypothetical protein [Bacillus suaedae]